MFDSGVRLLVVLFIVIAYMRYVRKAIENIRWWMHTLTTVSGALPGRGPRMRQVPAVEPMNRRPQVIVIRDKLPVTIPDHTVGLRSGFPSDHHESSRRNHMLLAADIRRKIPTRSTHSQNLQNEMKAVIASVMRQSIRPSNLLRPTVDVQEQAQPPLRACRSTASRPAISQNTQASSRRRDVRFVEDGEVRRPSAALARGPAGCTRSPIQSR